MTASIRVTHRTANEAVVEAYVPDVVAEGFLAVDMENRLPELLQAVMSADPNAVTEMQLDRDQGSFEISIRIPRMGVTETRRVRWH